MNTDKKWRRRIAIAAAILFLITLGPVSYSGGVFKTEFEILDKYFAARVDLVPIVDEVLGENRILKAAAGELLRSIEFRDKTIADQRETIEANDETIGYLVDQVEDLKNRPPEVVEVEVPVEVPGPERIVEVEVPGPERVVEIPVEVVVMCPGDPRCPAPPPPVDECVEKPWRSKCRDGGDRDHDKKNPEPEPDPDPPCPKPKPKPDCGKKHKHGKGHKNWRSKR